MVRLAGSRREQGAGGSTREQGAGSTTRSLLYTYTVQHNWPAVLQSYTGRLVFLLRYPSWVVGRSDISCIPRSIYSGPTRKTWLESETRTEVELKVEKVQNYCWINNKLVLKPFHIFVNYQKTDITLLVVYFVGKVIILSWTSQKFVYHNLWFAALCPSILKL